MKEIASYFNILGCWLSKIQNYLILSIIAKKILVCLLVSIVVVEQIFSFEGNILWMKDDLLWPQIDHSLYGVTINFDIFCWFMKLGLDYDGENNLDTIIKVSLL